MGAKPRPGTVLDLQGYFCDALGMKPNKVESYFEFIDWPNKLGARFKRYLPTGFRELATLVRDWGGEYDRDRRQFTIPKPGAPPAVEGEEIIEGEIERVETLPDKDWVHVYVAGIRKPLAIKPDLATPGLKPGNKIRAEVGIGESWLFIHRFDIPKEAVKEAPVVEFPRQPTEAKGPQPYTRLGYHPDFPIDKILSGKFSFRLNIGEGIEELMAEIHAAGRIIEPLICRPHRKLTYIEVGPGERRLLAAKKLSMKTVPVIVDNFTDQEFDRIRLLENIARKDLTDYEMARVLDHMLKTYPDDYPTQKALADEFGKTEAWISYHLAHKDFVEKELRPRGIDPASVTEGQTRAIRELPPDKREEILTAVKTTHRVPSWTEIKKFVAPPPPEETPEIGKEAEIEKVSEESIGVGFEPTKPTAEPETLVHCENCNVGTFRPQIFHGHTLCPRCYEEAMRDPEKFAAKIKKPAKPKREIGETKPKPQPLLTGFEIECAECHTRLLIDHREFPDGKIDHKLTELPSR